jgi:hypothetical protein
LSLEFGLGAMFYTAIWVAETAISWFYFFTGLPVMGLSAATDIPTGEFDAKCYIFRIILLTYAEIYLFHMSYCILIAMHAIAIGYEVLDSIGLHVRKVRGASMTLDFSQSQRKEIKWIDRWRSQDLTLV